MTAGRCRSVRLDEKMQNPKLQTLKAALFAVPSATVFAILDGASVPDLPATLFSFQPEHVCLYRGTLDPDMAEVAPYLVVLEREDAFTDWVLTHGWGKCWGIFGSSVAGIRELRNHFRRFVTVSEASTGKPLYFRYYDPRVLGVYLSKCNAQELKSFFGPVASFVSEEMKTGNLRKFLQVDNGLRQDRISVA